MAFFIKNMKVVNALKTFDAKVNQTVQRETKENGNPLNYYSDAFVNKELPPEPVQLTLF